MELGSTFPSKMLELGSTLPKNKNFTIQYVYTSVYSICHVKWNPVAKGEPSSICLSKLLGKWNSVSFVHAGESGTKTGSNRLHICEFSALYFAIRLQNAWIIFSVLSMFSWII